VLIKGIELWDFRVNYIRNKTECVKSKI